MSHTRFLAAAVIIILVIIIGFVLSVPHARDGTLPASSQTEDASVPIVSLHDTFKKGVHTITGSLTVPNVCTTVTAQATLTESMHIALSVPEDTDICLQVPTKVNFSVTISAPATTPITATVNGSVATVITS